MRSCAWYLEGHSVSEHACHDVQNFHTCTMARGLKEAGEGGLAAPVVHTFVNTPVLNNLHAVHSAWQRNFEDEACVKSLRSYARTALE